MANVTKTNGAGALDQFSLVKLTAGVLVVCAAITDIPYGQVTDSAAIGDKVNVQTSSHDTKLVAGASIVDGAELMCAAGGKVVTAAGATAIVIGRALETVTADKQIFRAELYAKKVALGA